MTLPDLPVTGAFLRSADEPEFLYPLTLYLCDECKLVQSQHNVNFASYYEEYAYTMAASSFACRFAKTLAETVATKWGLGLGDRVLEIGSADGLQLSYFKALGCDVCGFEPSRVLSEAAVKAGVPTITGLFSEEAASEVPEPDRKFQLIILTHVLDHLPSQREFLDAALKLIDQERGLLLIEVHDFEETFKHTEYCLLQHEHTVCPTAASLQRMFASKGLDIIDVGVLPEEVKRAHSLMVVATPHGSQHANQRLDEIPLGPMGEIAALTAFGLRVEKAIARTSDYVKKARMGGRKVAAFGAGGRGIMTMANAVAPGEVEYVCDSSPAHRGMFTPKAHVLIASPEEPQQHAVDEIIVFSYGYIDEIRAQLAEFIKGGGAVTSLLEVLDGADPQVAPA